MTPNLTPGTPTDAEVTERFYQEVQAYQSLEDDKSRTMDWWLCRKVMILEADRRRLEVLTNERDEYRDAVIDMVSQHCYDDRFSRPEANVYVYSDNALSANETTIDMLVQMGQMVEIHPDPKHPKVTCWTWAARAAGEDK